jgi:hypothetical protein
MDRLTIIKEAMAEDIDYEGLPETAGHGIHMLAGALVSISRVLEGCPKHAMLITV